MVNAQVQISRQLTKMKRIITEISEENPKISQKMDGLLYSVLKVEKMINKLSYQEQQIYINEYQIDDLNIKDDNDENFTEANEIIEKFKRTTYKFEKKMNIFLNETYFKNKGYEKEKEKEIEREYRHKTKSKKKEPEEYFDDDDSLQMKNAQIREILDKLRIQYNNQEQK